MTGDKLLPLSGSSSPSLVGVTEHQAYTKSSEGRKVSLLGVLEAVPGP